MVGRRAVPTYPTYPGYPDYGYGMSSPYGVGGGGFSNSYSPFGSTYGLGGGNIMHFGGVGGGRSGFGLWP